MDMENAKMLCPYCSSKFTPEMNATYEKISEGCDTCGYGEESVVTVEIYCENCEKLVYRKETHHRPNG